MKMQVSIVVAAALILCGAANGVERQLINLGPAGRTSGNGSAINDSGQVAGYSIVDLDQRGFFYSDGAMADLGSLGVTYGGGDVTGINNSGQAVGSRSVALHTSHAFLYDHGTVTDLGTLGGQSARALAINNAGQVGGSFTDVTNVAHGFVLTGGTLTDVGSLGGSMTTVASINDTGMAVGTSYLSGGTQSHAFVFDSGVITDLGLPSTYSGAYGINNAGEIVGQMWNVSGEAHGFYYYKGAAIELESPDGSAATARAINDRGQIVGYSHTIGVSDYRAVLWQGGVLIDLNSLLSPAYSGYTLMYAEDINNNGWITGQMLDPGGYRRAFILTPEPATIMLLAAGGLTGRRLRRRQA
jgi:probable HAF family extracellular repeat protein